MVNKSNNYKLFLPIEMNAISIGMSILGMNDRPLYEGKPI